MHDPLVSHRMRKIPESATLKLNSLINEMTAKGMNILNLTAGEPDGNTPQEVKDAAVEALEQNKTRYTASSGILKLRERIAKKFIEENSVKCSPDDIIVSNGGKQAIFNFFLATLEPGDEVLVPSPFWLSYTPMIRLANGVPVLVKSTIDDSYKINIDRLEEMSTERTRAIVINYPNNPTGVSYSKEELRALADFAIRHDILILSDEVYEKLDYKGFTSIASLGEDVAERTVTVNSFSKSYNMTGWRVGYCTGPNPVIKAMCVFQGHSTSNINSIAQHAAIAALDLDNSLDRTRLQKFQKRRDIICQGLSGIEGVRFVKPDGAFYLFVNCAGIIGKKVKNSTEVAEYLLKKHHVGVVPGVVFGDDKSLRISYAISEEGIQEGCKRLKEGFSILLNQK